MSFVNLEFPGIVCFCFLLFLAIFENQEGSSVETKLLIVLIFGFSVDLDLLEMVD